MPPGGRGWPRVSASYVPCGRATPIRRGPIPARTDGRAPRDSLGVHLALAPLGGLEAGPSEPHVEPGRLAAVHFGGEQPVEECARGERVVGGLADAEVEGSEYAGEAELLEDGDEVVSGRHDGPPHRGQP